MATFLLSIFLQGVAAPTARADSSGCHYHMNDIAGFPTIVPWTGLCLKIKGDGRLVEELDSNWGASGRLCAWRIDFVVRRMEGGKWNILQRFPGPDRQSSQCGVQVDGDGPIHRAIRVNKTYPVSQVCAILYQGEAWVDNACLDVAGRFVPPRPEMTGITLRPRSAPTKCIDVPFGSPDNSVQIVQWDCNGGRNQRWNLVPTPPYFPTPTYFIKNSKTGKCLAVQNASKSPGAGIVQYDCNGTTNSRWSISWQWIQDRNEWDARITNIRSGLKVDVERGGAENGSRLIQWPHNGSSNQVFTNHA